MLLSKENRQNSRRVSTNKSDIILYFCTLHILSGNTERYVFRPDAKVAFNSEMTKLPLSIFFFITSFPYDSLRLRRGDIDI